MPTAVTVELARVCGACRARVGINRLLDEPRCSACDSELAVTSRDWSELLAAVTGSAARLTAGERRRLGVAGFELHVSRGSEACAACGGELEAVSDGVRCGRCGVAPPHRALADASLDTGVDWVVGEDPPRADGASRDAAATLACDRCGAPLPLSDDAPTVRCGHCGAVSHVPRAFLRRGLRALPAPLSLFGPRLVAAAASDDAVRAGVLDWRGPAAALLLEDETVVIAGVRSRWAPNRARNDVVEVFERFVLALTTDLRVVAHALEESATRSGAPHAPPPLARAEGGVLAFGGEPWSVALPSGRSRLGKQRAIGTAASWRGHALELRGERLTVASVDQSVRTASDSAPEPLDASPAARDDTVDAPAPAPLLELRGVLAVGHGPGGGVLAITKKGDRGVARLFDAELGEANALTIAAPDEPSPAAWLAQVGVGADGALATRQGAQAVIRDRAGAEPRKLALPGKRAKSSVVLPLRDGGLFEIGAEGLLRRLDGAAVIRFDSAREARPTRKSAAQVMQALSAEMMANALQAAQRDQAVEDARWEASQRPRRIAGVITFVVITLFVVGLYLAVFLGAVK